MCQGLDLVGLAGDTSEGSTVNGSSSSLGRTKRIVVVAEPGELGRARLSIDAEGLVVTPGWVDIHTHYDGQATWDSDLAPSSTNGVTSLVMGNCGVGFAPARPDRHDWLISLLEGVEDIPGTALAEGMGWGWESFEQYLEVLDRRRWKMDIGTQVPHAALRTYVMGERGADRSTRASDDEIAAMSSLAEAAVLAGALGFTTSRTWGHRVHGFLELLVRGFDRMFPLTDPPDYEPASSASIAGLAARGGLDPAELLYDLLLEDEGRRLLYLPLMNYARGNLDDLREMLVSPHTIFGLSDAGAHCNAISDGTFPTTAITHWTRGERLDLEYVVHQQTQRTAAPYRLAQRGAGSTGCGGPPATRLCERLGRSRPGHDDRVFNLSRRASRAPVSRELRGGRSGWALRPLAHPRVASCSWSGRRMTGHPVGGA
jgi:N-acyl-D-aspartate/D-glutamate deacylase